MTSCYIPFWFFLFAVFAAVYFFFCSRAIAR